VRHWLSLIKPGDAMLALTVGIACGLALPMLWQGGLGERVVIRQGGRLLTELNLQTRRTLQVKGPLGTTVIVVEPGRARVLSDPGPRQYCVLQGWLHRPGEIAICAPNQVSLAITGRARTYDSLSY